MKKWWIVLGTCLVLGLSVLGMRQVQQVQIVSAQTLHQHPVIIIDPGHGGMDGGAQANGVTEKDVNLAVSLTLRDLLSQQGFHVIMTREDDRSIHEEGLTQISRQKRSDMYQRLKIIEDHPEAIFISVHQNKVPPVEHRSFIARTTLSPKSSHKNCRIPSSRICSRTIPARSNPRKTTSFCCMKHRFRL